MRFGSILLAGLFACAGSEAPDGVALAVSPSESSPGDSVTVTLTTTRERGVGYNLCAGTLEHRTGDTWQPLPPNRVCTMELRILQPGDEASFTLALEPSLGPGEYRYHVSVEQMDGTGMTAVRSDPFTVH
jgi:hypothetical protein